MVFDWSYPPALQFANSSLRNFAEELRPHSIAFFDGGILCDPLEGWENVFLHCLSEALSVKILCEATRNLNIHDMVVAAFVHDAYKRREVEVVDQTEPQNHPLAFSQSESDGKKWLETLGYSPNVVHLQTGFGDTAARKIFAGEISDFDRRLLHYVDDITYGDQVVSIEERMSRQEATPRYAAQNEWHRQFFGGMTLYQAKRIMNERTEVELAKMVGLSDHGNLVGWIRDRHF